MKQRLTTTVRRKNNQRQPVRRGHPVQRPRGRVQHLLHMQTHLAEAPAQRQEVPRSRLPGHGHPPVQGHPLQLRGARHPGPGGEAGPARRQLLPLEGQCFTGCRHFSRAAVLSL